MVLNYIGSKKSLLYFIEYVLKQNIKLTKNLVFGDLFAGTGVVGNYINTKYSMKNISNDLEYYSYLINYANLKCQYTDKLKTIIGELNKMKGEDGLIHRLYSPSGGNEYGRMFFTCENAKKVDANRIHLENLKEEKKIDENEYIFLLASIVESIDKVANTACVYGAYLKKFKKAALKDYVVKPIHTKTLINNSKDNIIHNKDANDIDDKFDIVYLDPPYNNRQYGGNYSQLNYIAKYNEEVEIKGKTGLVKGYNKSKYSQKPNVKEAFSKLINKLNTNHILISYNNEGILSLQELQELLSQKGKVTSYILKYKKFKSQKKTNKFVEEYLHYVDCSDIGESKIVYVTKEEMLIKAVR